MKKLLGLLLIALPAWSHAAQNREVTAFYANLQGDWQVAGDAPDYSVRYSLNNQGLHVQGQECQAGPYAECYFIEADYVLRENNPVQRVYPTYGATDVQIQSVSPTEITKREFNPIDAKTYLVLTERLRDQSSLQIIRQTWRVRGGRDGQDVMVKEEIVELHRAGEPTGITSANTDAGGLLQ